MKWHKDQEGDERVIKKFAWLPIQDDTDIYWLENVELHQEFTSEIRLDDGTLVRMAISPKWITITAIGDSDKL